MNELECFDDLVSILSRNGIKYNYEYHNMGDNKGDCMYERITVPRMGLRIERTNSIFVAHQSFRAVSFGRTIAFEEIGDYLHICNKKKRIRVPLPPHSTECAEFVEKTGLQKLVEQMNAIKEILK